ncbi:MAG TPA: hypothetical protein VJ773_01535 [Gemmatimonadales bacterium]|nr:hypothetical protein [Gemmatimonadales bacterium]
MTTYKVEQHRVSYRGQAFHFVSCEPRPANERRGEEALPAMWYLMQAGKRWAVMPQLPDQGADEIRRDFCSWLEAHVFAAPG